MVIKIAFNSKIKAFFLSHWKLLAYICGGLLFALTVVVTLILCLRPSQVEIRKLTPSDIKPGTPVTTITLEDDETELYNGNTLDTKFPAFSPYIRKTTDYLLDESEFTDTDGVQYFFYQLASGRRVLYKTIKNGVEEETGKFTLKNRDASEFNHVSFGSIHQENDKTILTLNLDWCVPFDVSYSPVTYFSGYDGRPYNLNSFTAEYVDITFFYSEELEEGKEEVLGQFSEAVWIPSENNLVTLRLALTEPGKFYGYDAEYNGTKLTFTFRNHKQAVNGRLDGIKIAVDAGHGGEQRGAAKELNGQEVEEKLLNRAIADSVKKHLEELGAEVIEIREGDEDVGLSERTVRSSKGDADFFLSIHNNSGNSGNRGLEIFYYYPFSQPAGKCVYDSLSEVYVQYFGYQNTGTLYFFPYLVIRNTHSPAILIEYSYMTDTVDLSQIVKPEVQDALGKATAQGILEFFNN